MSESELRKGYDARRVLIEVEHILTPRFDAQGVYLLGEELEMLRNVTQYLNEQATFVDSYHLDYYMMADSSDWDAIQAIVANIERKLMGNENVLWGFANSWVENLSFTQSGDGVAEATVTVEDEDYIVVLEAVSCKNQTGTRGTMQIQVWQGGIKMVLAYDTVQPQYRPSLWSGKITLIAGDKVVVRQGVALDGDVYIANAWGHTMMVPD